MTDNLKERLRNLAGLALRPTIVAFVLISVCWIAGLTQALDHLFYKYAALLQQAPAVKNIVLVGTDALEEPTESQATMLKTLIAAKPKRIVWLAPPDEPGFYELAKQTDVLALGRSVLLSPGGRMTLSPLPESASGFPTVVVPPPVADQHKPWPTELTIEGQTWPTLAAKLATEENVQVPTEGLHPQADWLQQPIPSLRFDQLRQIPPDFFENRIVIVGASLPAHLRAMDAVPVVGGKLSQLQVQGYTVHALINGRTLGSLSTATQALLMMCLLPLVSLVFSQLYVRALRKAYLVLIAGCFVTNLLGLLVFSVWIPLSLMILGVTVLFFHQLHHRHLSILMALRAFSLSFTELAEQHLPNDEGEIGTGWQHVDQGPFSQLHRTLDRLSTHMSRTKQPADASEERRVVSLGTGTHGGRR